MLPNRINLVGRFCSGKGFIADMLCHHRGFKEISYSDPLYEELAASKGLTVDFLKDNKADYRSDLQGWGHGRRQTDADYWINEREKTVDKYRRERTSNEHVREFLNANVPGPAHLFPVVEAGTRYENEALSAMKLGGFVVRVVTPQKIRYQRYHNKYGKFPTEEQNNHVTEVATDTLPVHVEIPGNLPASLILPTLEALYALLVTFAEPQP